MRKIILRRLGIAFVFCFLLIRLSSCNGNGGSIDSVGEVYSPSGNTTSSVSSSSVPEFTTSDLLSYSNSGDTSSIVSNVGSVTSSSSTTTVALSASSIGLPSGGTVTLTITGNGISYVQEASASSDGNVYFQVPVIATGTTVTVSIVVKASDGTVSSSGSETQTVTDSSSLVNVSLSGNQSQVWSLPDPLTVSVSSASVDYTPTGNVTFSVVGVDNPPSGTLSYSWAKADGSPLSSTSDSCSCSLSDLLEASPTPGPHNLTVMVTATYTEEDGTVTSASGSGVVEVSVYGLPGTLTIEASPASIVYNATAPQDVTFSLTGVDEPPYGSLSYSWTDADGNALPGSASSYTGNLLNLLGGNASVAGSYTVQVDLTVSYTADDATTVLGTASGTGSVSVTVLEIPGFNIQITPPDGVSLHSDGLGYDVADLSQEFSFSTNPASSAFPDDTEFTWTLVGSINKSGASVTASPSDLGVTAIMLYSDEAKNCTIKCVATSETAINSPKEKNFVLKLYKPKLPKPVVGAPTSSNGSYVTGTTYSFYAVSSGSASDTNLTFSLASSSPSMPTGTSYNWQYSTDGSSWSSLTGNSGGSSYGPTALGTIWTSSMPAEFQIKCTAVKDGYESATSDPITVKVLQKIIPGFYVEIVGLPGEQNSTMPTVCYKVTNDSVVSVKLWKKGGETGEIPPNGSGATFTWKVDSGDTIWTGTTQEETLNVSSILTALGTTYNALVPWDGSGTQPTGGLQVRITCTIELDGLTKNSDSSSTYETKNVLTLYRQPDP